MTPSRVFNSSLLYSKKERRERELDSTAYQFSHVTSRLLFPPYLRKKVGTVDEKQPAETDMMCHRFNSYSMQVFSTMTIIQYK